MKSTVIQMDKGQFGRRTAYFHGWVKIPGRPLIGCTIRNVVESRAVLVFNKPVCLPYGFVLSIDGTTQLYGCEVRQHYGDRVAVCFVDVDTIPQIAAPANGDTAGHWMEASPARDARMSEYSKAS
ncbi:MAG: hypothetical protein HOP09_01570 [Hyphomicrobium sp.]|nr:hypothetical protein [Hyphomicrobium sp.]